MTVVLLGQDVQQLRGLCPEDYSEGRSLGVLQRTAGPVPEDRSPQLPLPHTLAPLQTVAGIVGEKLVKIGLYLHIDYCTVGCRL